MHLVSITRSKSHGAKSWFYPEQYHLSEKWRLPQLQRPTGSWHYNLSLFEAKNSNFLSSMPCGAAICCYTQKKPKQLQPSYCLSVSNWQRGHYSNCYATTDQIFRTLHWSIHLLLQMPFIIVNQLQDLSSISALLITYSTRTSLFFLFN